MRTSGLRHSRESKRRRDRVVDVCRSLPEVEVSEVGNKHEHIAFKVRKRIFAYYLFDHHGDGMVAMCCKAGPGEQGRLVEESPRRFFVPPYLGPKGWVGMRLDLPKVSWPEVAYLMRSSYRLTAPRTLAGQVS